MFENWDIPEKKQTAGGWLRRIWNFQGYQGDSMWNFQEVNKNEVPKISKGQKNNVEFPGGFVLSGISRGKVKK